MTPPVEPPVLRRGSRRGARVRRAPRRPRSPSTATTATISSASRRLRAGEHVTAADGYGRWRAYEVAARAPAVRRPRARSRSSRTSRRSRPALTVAFALTKGQKPELVVAEAHRARRRPDHAGARRRARSCTGTTPRRAAASTRLARVAREAAMQSRRARHPGGRRPGRAGRAGAVTPASWSPTADGVAARARAARRRPGRRVGGLVGPEGGFDDDELRGVRRRAPPGRRPVRAAGRDRGDRGGRGARWPARRGTSSAERC